MTGFLRQVGRVAAGLSDEARDDAMEDDARVEAVRSRTSRNASTVSGARMRSSSMTKLPAFVTTRHAVRAPSGAGASCAAPSCGARSRQSSRLASAHGFRPRTLLPSIRPMIATPRSAVQPQRRRSSAALTVLAISIAIVSGPTPPGTGVSAPATAATSGCTSPTSTEPRLVEHLRAAPGCVAEDALRLVGRGDGVDADVDDDGAGFDELRASRTPGRPMAATRMSAVRAIAGRSRVREWQIVTVAFLCSSSAAIGLPTMSERPMTTACLPSIGVLRAHEQLDDAGRRARREPFAVLHDAARRDRAEAVDVLAGIDRVEHSLLGVGAQRFRQRRLDENAVVLRVLVEAVDDGEQGARASSTPGSRSRCTPMPASSAVLSLLRT